MTAPDPIENPARSGLMDRAKAIVLKPKETWPVIEREQGGIGALYTGYALILAALPALAMFVRGITIGYGMFGFTWRPGFAGSLSMAISQYVMALVSVTLLAFIIDFVVTQFDGKSNRLNAFKLAIYSSTAAWLAAIFGAIPGVSFLSLLGFYSFYLLYTGLPVLMKVPQAKAAFCTIVIVIVAIVLAVIAGAVTSKVSSLFVGGGSGINGGTITAPGGGSIDTAKLEEASRKIEEMAKNPENIKPVDPARLRDLLPESINGFRRISIESQSMAAAGISGAQASAVYSANDRDIDVEITDMAAIGAMAGLGAALNINQEKQTDTGFERTRTENGAIIREEWNEEGKYGSYSVTVAGRFTLSVDGSADSFDTLKGIAGGIDQRKLAALAK